MVIRLIDGEFPEYEQVIPKENDKRLVMEKRERFIGCLEKGFDDGEREGRRN